MKQEHASATADVLSAYLDGELDETSACRTRKRLSSDVHARRRLEDYRRLDERVRQALRPALAEPVPERLTQLLELTDASGEQSAPVSVPNAGGH